MPIPSIITTTSLKFLSGLSNNTDSIIPMAVKDTMSNCAIVHTYSKEGGKDDARERAIEEFGTGVVWLFGIPLIKKLMDKTIYPLLHLKSDFDVRVLEDEKRLSAIKESLADTKNKALTDEKELFLNLDNKNEVLKEFYNKDLYKGLFIGKFAIATGLSAIALSKLIKYKQKTTQKRIENEFKENIASRTLLNKDIKDFKLQNTVFETFLGKKDSKNLSFKGVKEIAEMFMFNDILNTSILDGVITGTRLKEGRKGEKKEILLKELFQILFIYGIAKPTQMLFEFIGKKANMPIELDPIVLFDKSLEENLSNSKDTIQSLMESDDVVSSIHNLDVKNPLIELLDKNGTIKTIKDKNNNITAISYKKALNSPHIKQTLGNLLSLENNIKNISKIKGFKLVSIFGNIALAAWAMGILQPKVNIFMRKILNNGDNRNPAIVKQENELYKQVNIADMIV